jgi:type II secretory pathway component PulK
MSNRPKPSDRRIRSQNVQTPKLQRAAKERPARRAGQRGSVLIVVLWVSFGLVSLALYFAHSMSFELRASDNRVAGVESEQAIAGAARYVSNILANAEEPGTVPDLNTYRFEAVPVGQATFWLIGSGDRTGAPDVPVFGLVDEASKLNLNTATPEMLELLPRMTPELAAAIKDWRDADEEVTQGGAESQVYSRLDPPYMCKNTNFESSDELRLVSGAYLDILYGEDANLNGVLDPNENDGDVSPPSDNRDGRLDLGILQYLTVYSRQPNTGTNVNNRQQLAPLLQEKFNADRANRILAQVGGQTFGSLLEFYFGSQMTREEFAQIEGDITVTNRPTEGLVNVNTASEAVLTCIPGIGTDNAPTLVAYRQSNPDKLNSLAWVKDALAWTPEADMEKVRRVGPWITGRTYQFTADIAAVGHHGRGYQRVKYVFDTSDGAPRILYRQDLTHLGWALGRQVRDALQIAKALP